MPKSINQLVERINPIGDYLDGVQKRFEKRGGSPGLPINSLPLFNHKIWGLHPGLTVVGGRTSQAKSAFVSQVAFDLADQGKRVLFLSLEQWVEELIERMFCNKMKIDNFDLLRGRFNVDFKIKFKWGSFTELAGKIPLIITDGIGKTFREVNTIVELFEPKPDVIILDFIQNIARKTNESREMMNEYIRHFREICLRNNIAGVLCSQINRLAMKESNREPSLATLKETGTLEEAADLVLLLHWDYFYTSDPLTKNKFKITVAKNRNGRTGVCEMFYVPEYYKFLEDEGELRKIVNQELSYTASCEELRF